MKTAIYNWSKYNKLIHERLNIFIGRMTNRYEKEWFKSNYDDVVQTCHMNIWQGISENKIKNIDNPVILIDLAIQSYYSSNKKINQTESEINDDAKTIIMIKRLKDTYPMTDVMDIIDIIGGI